MLWITAALASGTTEAGKTCAAVEVAVEGLDGVKVRFPEQPCVFAVGAKPTTPLKYEIVVEASPGRVENRDSYCGSFDASGFIIEPRVVQGENAYHPWDHGECESMADSHSTPRPGTYPGAFTWSPHAWSGPSCTGEPLGAAFVPGPASFEVSFGGTRKGKPFSVRAAYPITLR